MVNQTRLFTEKTPGRPRYQYKSNGPTIHDVEVAEVLDELKKKHGYALARKLRTLL
jgi:hypothetical protein